MSVLCSFFEANFGGIRTITSRKNFKLTISSCVSVRMSRYWARGKFGEQERGVRVARGTATCNSSFLSNIIKAINAAVNLKFYYCRARSKQYASMFTWLYFFFLLKHMVNASSCTAELWMHSGDSGLLSSQQLDELRIVYWRHQCSIGIWSTLALLNLIRRIFLLCCKEI